MNSLKLCITIFTDLLPSSDLLSEIGKVRLKKGRIEDTFYVHVFSVIGIFRNERARRRSGDRLRESGDGRRESIYHSDRTRNRANDVAKQVSYSNILEFVASNTFGLRREKNFYLKL